MNKDITKISAPDKIVFAITVKSMIKRPEKEILNAESIKLNKLNRVYVSKYDASVIGKLKKLRHTVIYYILDKEENKKEYQKLLVFLNRKNKIDFSKPIYFSVNSPYKKKVEKNKKSPEKYLDTYFYRK